MKLLLMMVLCCSSLCASEVKHYGAGQDFASKNPTGQPKDAKDIPGYKGTNIPEANFSHGNIQGKIEEKMKEMGVEGGRPGVVIKIEND